jgi:FkbM family methyltransferase
MSFRFLRSLKKAHRAREIVHCIQMSPDWWRLTRMYLGLLEPEFPMTFRLRDGAKLRLETFHDLVTAWIIFFRPEYDVRASDHTIIDVGGNIGAFSLFAALKAPNAKVWALEPFPKTRERLRDTITANKLDDRVILLQLALEGKDGSSWMADTGAPAQSLAATDREPEKGGFKVEAITLASLLEREKIKRVDLLKVDIEGGEHRAFPAVPKDVWKKIDRVALEYHPDGPKQNLFNILLNEGFHLELDDIAGPDSGVARFSKFQ